jgi:dTDP-4-dehydrorhamnose reductase
MKKKIYIAGCGGMLGEAFYKIYKDDFILKCTDKDVNESWLTFLDFRDFDAYKKDVYDFNPDYLFHIGAHTSLEYCDTNQDDAYLTNTIAVENAVHISNALNIPMLYISTAGILMEHKILLTIGISQIRLGIMHAVNGLAKYMYNKIKHSI